MAAIAVAMIRKRESEALSNDGLGGSAATNALRHGHRASSLTRAVSDAAHVFDKKGPTWADVRKQLEDKGVDMKVSDARDDEIKRVILAAPEAFLQDEFQCPPMVGVERRQRT
ncbi:hypothetical protein T484DRAFT_1911524 [Baffinella frigidus]|nr:hypothetical protein T484DRAFT_1911524 [Cryptophyta sp. CCMP2293]